MVTGANGDELHVTIGATSASILGMTVGWRILRGAWPHESVLDAVRRAFDRARERRARNRAEVRYVREVETHIQQNGGRLVVRVSARTVPVVGAPVARQSEQVRPYADLAVPAVRGCRSDVTARGRQLAAPWTPLRSEAPASPVNTRTETEETPWFRSRR